MTASASSHRPSALPDPYPGALRRSLHGGHSLGGVPFRGRAGGNLERRVHGEPGADLGSDVTWKLDLGPGMGM